jgi:hypothetical protein
VLLQISDLSAHRLLGQWSIRPGKAPAGCPARAATYAGLLDQAGQRMETTRGADLSLPSDREMSSNAKRPPAPELGQALADPADRPADPLALMPATPDYHAAKVTERIPGFHRETGLTPVLDLPRPVLHRVSAPNTQVHLGVVTEMDHLVGRLDHPAAPAFRRAWLFAGVDDCAGGTHPSNSAPLSPRSVDGWAPAPDLEAKVHGHDIMINAIKKRR